MPTPVRPTILSMIPYSPGKPIDEVKRELGLERVIKLASNENPFGPSPKAVEAIKAAASEVNFYPDGSAFALKQAISRKFEFPAEQIMLGAGSEEIIQNLGLMFLESEDDEVICAQRSFARYGAAAKVAGCRLTQVPLDGQHRHDLPAMARAIGRNTKLLFICNPNNPTGTAITRADFEQFMRDVPEHVCVVLDEAYFEFAGDAPDVLDGLEFVKGGRNLVALRTFSKILGLAGMRIGYGFGPAYIADALHRVRLPFHVSNLSQAAATAALSDDEHIHRTVENNRRGLKIISDALRAEGASVIESFTNFVYADLHRPSRPVFDELLRMGIIVRPGDVFGDPTFVRVSVGTEEENLAFVEAFQSAMRAVHA